ncbi:MAG TPA: transcription elongation factor GreA [Candidatus Saccharimonadia bacterium]|nr:transcription elongation factor GreA [Candidatus Saccharimonadia bacterium]
MSNTTKTEFHLTADGIQALKDELKELTTTKRVEIAERLKEAKADGDLGENAMYDAARDEQGFIEGRIAEIEHILKHAIIISAKKGDKVSLGSTVHVELEGGSQRYTIVGSTEANPDEGKISDESLVGKALLGKKPGEEVEIEVPSGKLTYKIMKVE